MSRLTLDVRLGVAVGVLVALFTVPIVLVSADGMSDVEFCGGSPGKNVALEQFSIAAARDIWLEFPALARSPELESDTPARVVVFRDGYDAKAAGIVGNIGSRAANLDKVVCVIQADGTRTVYANVSLQGSRFAH